ncbi:hypothetical protein MAFF211271_00630 [Ralstonia syzygii subsp. indonesiensis]|nr:hypothetical protein MAFF211271_00630 [Ralstonia pseudosolanacearum]
MVSSPGRETAERKHLRIDGRTGGMATRLKGSRTRDTRDGGLASIGNIAPRAGRAARTHGMNGEIPMLL